MKFEDVMQELEGEVTGSVSCLAGDKVGLFGVATDDRQDSIHTLG